MGWKIVINIGTEPHAVTHKEGGDDEIKLNELGDPIAPVDFNNQEMKKAVIEKLTSHPSAVVGRVYYNEADNHYYVYRP